VIRHLLLLAGLFPVIVVSLILGAATGLVGGVVLGGATAAQAIESYLQNWRNG
jgi:hypothetical protein